MRHGRLPKCKIRLLFSTLRRRLLACIQQSSLFINVTEVSQPIEGHYLIHVINSSSEIQVSLYGNNLTVSRFLSAYHIVLICLSSPLPEFSLDDKWERVWDL